MNTNTIMVIVTFFILFFLGLAGVCHWVKIELTKGGAKTWQLVTSLGLVIIGSVFLLVDMILNNQ